MSTTANVSAAKPKIGGAISYAPVGTTLPTDAVSELNEAFTSLGYISEDGFKNSSSITSNKVKAWGGDVVLVVQSDSSDECSFTLIESTNPDVLKAVHGAGNVTGTIDSGITVKVNSAAHENFAWVIDMVLKGGAVKRIVLPSAAISSVDEVIYNDTSAIGYAIKLTATADAEGNTHYEYIKSKTS